MESATAKLELGLERLAKAGDDADLLGLALQSLHGALEDHYRARLAADQHIPEDQRAAMLDPKRVQWKDLLDAMQLYADLGAPEREQIWRMNAARTKVAHGGRYAGGRAELEGYAKLVQAQLGYTPPPPTGRARERATRQPSDKPEQSPSPRSRAAPAADDIPRAVRSSPSKAQPAPPRSRLGWSAALLALALVFGLASFVVLRGAGGAPAQIAAAPSSTAAAAPEAIEAADTSAAPAAPRAAVVASPEGLNLRADHSLAAGVIVLLRDGTRVTVVDGPVAAEGFQWWSVEFDGRRGWCAGEFLRFE